MNARVILLNTVYFFLIISVRYLILAGGAYWLCWVKKKNAWMHKRIQPEFPKREIILGEIRWSVLTSFIFAFAGAVAYDAWLDGGTRVYLDISQYGWGYFALSIFVLAFLHDTYFYWTHRFLHWPPVFKRIHYVHHLSRNPSPWAAFSFHPIEGVIEAAILPILVFVIPVHPAALLVLLMMMSVFGVVNHLGYELYPSFMEKNRFFKLWISATNHHQHHRWNQGNYGLYFTWWDRWLKTHRG